MLCKYEFRNIDEFLKDYDSVANVDNVGKGMTYLENKVEGKLSDFSNAINDYFYFHFHLLPDDSYDGHTYYFLFGIEIGEDKKQFIVHYNYFY